MKVCAKNNLIIPKVDFPPPALFPKFAGFQGPISELIFFLLSGAAQQRGICKKQLLYGVSGTVSFRKMAETVICNSLRL